MKRLLAVLFLLFGMGVFIGFVIGRRTADQQQWKSNQHLQVDCYDANGKLSPPTAGFADLGGYIVACAPGQTARIHQR
jgi:hypothetical protein